MDAVGVRRMRTIKKATPRGDQNNQLHDTTEERVLSMLSNMPQDRKTLALSLESRTGNCGKQ